MEGIQGPVPGVGQSPPSQDQGSRKLTPMWHESSSSRVWERGPGAFESSLPLAQALSFCLSLLVILDIPEGPRGQLLRRELSVLPPLLSEGDCLGLFPTWSYTASIHHRKGLCTQHYPHSLKVKWVTSKLTPLPPPMSWLPKIRKRSKMLFSLI